MGGGRVQLGTVKKKLCSMLSSVLESYVGCSKIQVPQVTDGLLGPCYLIVVLILLDVSVAFDTLHFLGFSDTMSPWFSSAF